MIGQSFARHVARFLPALALAFAVLFASRSASAYAWMIRHDYAGCTACHADPSGGGLLTAYGRAQGEVLLRTHYKKGAEEEDPGTIGDFLFGAITLPESLLLGGDIRAMSMYIKPQFGPSVKKTFLMQADLAGQLSVDRVRVNGSLGYANEGALPASVTHGTGDRLVSRVFWGGVDIGEDRQFLLRAGRMNLPFGIRNLEHTMWVRSQTHTDTNDAQQHGVAFSYNGETFRGEIMAIAGNYQIHPDSLRQRGYSGYAEYDAITHLALGASSLVTHQSADLLLRTPVWRHAHGVFARYAPIEELVLMTETDLLFESQPPPAPNRLGVATDVQVDLEPVQGLHVIGTGEILDAYLSQNPPSYRLWGSLAWFFLPHVDLRFDALWESDALPKSRSNADVFLAQLHAYL